MILSGHALAYWLLVAVAMAAYAWLAWTGQSASASQRPYAQIALAGAWLLHGALIVWALVESPLRFGFAPALSVTAWLVLTLYALESRLLPGLRARWALAGLSVLALALAALYPGAALHAQASAWLPLHGALGVASYGLFATAVIHAWLMMRAENQMRQGLAGAGASTGAGVPLLTLERLTFRFVGAGFVLLTATLIAGALFGEQLYGPHDARWMWDHKRVFSLLSWVLFAVLLAGRWRMGWRGKRAVRFLYAGSGLLLLGYVGSRFVLEVILERAP